MRQPLRFDSRLADSAGPEGSPEIIPPSRLLAFNVAFWACWGAMISAILLDLLPRGTAPPLAVLGYSFGGAAIWAILAPGLIRLSRIRLADPSRRRGRALLTMIFGVALACLVSAVVSGLTYILSDTLAEIGFGVMFRHRLPLDTMAALLVLAFGRARAYLDDLHRRQGEAAALKSEIAEMRLEALHAQLNPHFLFNTLNAVAEVAETDPARVQRILSHLSDLLRHTLTRANEPQITLETELLLLERYFEILELRYDGYLRTRIVTDPSVRGAIVPNMILQPIAENALKHGVARSTDPGWIEARAARNGGQLVLTISDSGPGIAGGRTDSRGHEGGGFGLRYTRERLRQLHGDAASFRLIPGQEGGMIAELSIPFKRSRTLQAQQDATAVARR